MNTNDVWGENIKVLGLLLSVKNEYFLGSAEGQSSQVTSLLGRVYTDYCADPHLYEDLSYAPRVAYEYK